MSGSRTIVVRWSDETDQSQSCGLRDAAGVVQEEESQTRSDYSNSYQERIREISISTKKDYALSALFNS